MIIGTLYRWQHRRRMKSLKMYREIGYRELWQDLRSRIGDEIDVMHSEICDEDNRFQASKKALTDKAQNVAIIKPITSSPPNVDDAWFSGPVVAQMFKLSESQIRKLVPIGKFPAAYKVGRALVWLGGDLDAFADLTAVNGLRIDSDRVITYNALSAIIRDRFQMAKDASLPYASSMAKTKYRALEGGQHISAANLKWSKFPAPIAFETHLGSNKVWDKNEVEDWIATEQKRLVNTGLVYKDTLGVLRTINFIGGSDGR